MNDRLPIPFPRGGGGRVVVEHAGGGWPDGLSWVIFAVLLALLLLAIASLALAFSNRPKSVATVESARSDALAELDLRYARGEIGRDEYLQRRVDLGGSVVPAAPAEATTAVGPPQPQT